MVESPYEKLHEKEVGLLNKKFPQKSRSIKSLFLLGILFFFLDRPNALGADEQTATQSIFINGKLSFIYLDMMPLPKWNLIPNPRPSEFNEINTLGLARAVINLGFNANDTYSISLQLRPDARQVTETNSPSTTGENVREFDGRIGDVYRAKPQVHLLDTYAINYTPSSSYKISLGVFAAVPSAQPLFSTLVPFGLMVEMPQKFLGTHLRSQNFNVDETSASITSGIGFDVMLIEGREDRGDAIYEEALDDSHKSPQAQDPYRGGVVAFFLPIQADHALHLTTGQISTKIDEGLAEELFALLSWRYAIFKEFLPISFSIDWRWSQEHFKRYESHRESLTQTSLQAATKVDLENQTAVILGLSSGNADLPNANDTAQIRSISGMQFDFALERKISQVAKFSAQAAIESRQESSDAGIKIGGFNVNEKLEKWVRRFALGIEYTLGKEW